MKHTKQTQVAHSIPRHECSKLPFKPNPCRGCATILPGSSTLPQESAETASNSGLRILWPFTFGGQEDYCDISRLPACHLATSNVTPENMIWPFQIKHIGKRFLPLKLIYSRMYTKPCPSTLHVTPCHSMPLHATPCHLKWREVASSGKFN